MNNDSSVDVLYCFRRQHAHFILVQQADVTGTPMLNDTAYHLITSILEAFMWDGELRGVENLGEGPGVVVANHMGAIGPVGLCSSLPMRLYPWVLGATVDPVEGPENLRKDFVEKVLRIRPPLSRTLARGLCKISTPLLLSLGCIPVPATHEAQKATFQRSLVLLKAGKFLLIVPEDPRLDPDPSTGIRPFKHGFLRLGELYARVSGRNLPFYPVVIHEAGLVVVGKPAEYNLLNGARLERLRMVRILERAVKSMHREITESEVFKPFLVAPH
jgi:1-acyl-sn-glycerol-3-phosphate acyltransferase